MRTQGSSSERSITNTANIRKFIQKLAVREYIGEPPVSDRAAARLGTAGEGIELQLRRAKPLLTKPGSAYRNAIRERWFHEL
jgi:hypothetical protein